MKIYYNSKIAKVFTFMRGFKTISLFGMVFTEKSSLPEKTILHEEVHAMQYKTLFFTGLYLSLLFLIIMAAFGYYGWWSIIVPVVIPPILFYIWYVVEFIVRLFLTFDKRKAYRDIAFEKEARSIETDWTLIPVMRHKAKPFSFLKYF